MMGCLVNTVVTLILVYQASGYQCDDGQCSGKDQCCNTQSFYGKCCQASAKCCYHSRWTACCGPLDQCCWGVHFSGVACCPQGFACCGGGRHRRRAGCCWETPIWIWIMLGLCGSIIVILLLLSLYQCIMEEIDEYQTQRNSGNLPSDNAWYYYDYGSTMTRSPRGFRASARSAPPDYDADPPPSYSNHGNNTRANQSNTSTPTENNSGRPKPPTPQTRQLGTGSESRGSEYYSATEDRVSASAGDSNWEYGSTASRATSRAASRVASRATETGGSASETLYSPVSHPGEGDVLQTFYEHSVPKLHRMLCSEHNCLVTDGSCVYCMDLTENDDIEVAENKEIMKSESVQKHLPTLDNLVVVDQQTENYITLKTTSY